MRRPQSTVAVADVTTNRQDERPHDRGGRDVDLGRLEFWPPDAGSDARDCQRGCRLRRPRLPVRMQAATAATAGVVAHRRR